MPQKYRVKPEIEIVTAVKFTGNNIDEVAQFVHGSLFVTDEICNGTRTTISVRFGRGNVAKPGEWIIYREYPSADYDDGFCVQSEKDFLENYVIDTE